MEKKESRELSYKLAVKLLDLMLKNGFLLPEEYEKIDALPSRWAARCRSFCCQLATDASSSHQDSERILPGVLRL